MKAIADLVQTILRIIPPCYLHSPQKSRKPEWLFEDAERVHGEAFEMLLSAAAGGVLVRLMTGLSVNFADWLDRTRTTASRL